VGLREAVFAIFLLVAAFSSGFSQSLGDHDVRTDLNGNILPWVTDDPAISYDYCLHRLWDFWRTVDTCPGGAPIYMVYRTWDDTTDHLGIAGDEFAMILDSWSRLYAYTGDRRIVDNMRMIAETYLQSPLSQAIADWSNLPYPCNTTANAIYDGDLIAGEGYLQPDKAGSFGNQLITLFEMTGDSTYLRIASGIATTLAYHTQIGDTATSPMPFRVYALTGELPDLETSNPYTTNWTPTMQLFERLSGMGLDTSGTLLHADSLLFNWLLTAPVQTEEWGPFYEDVVGYSNTQINATAFVRYLIAHPERDPQWQQHARAVLDWTYTTFADSDWSDYNVYPIMEQTQYMVVGNSHTADYAATELLYAEATGDTSRVAESILQLNWATYSVDSDGSNRYPFDYVWFTDGYGDYVRHYLNAMAADPVLAPADAPHILRSSSVVTTVDLSSGTLKYTTWDTNSTELIRLPNEPSVITIDTGALPLFSGVSSDILGADGWSWRPLATGGIAVIHKTNSHNVSISLAPLSKVTENPVQSKIQFSLIGKRLSVTLTDLGPVRIELLNLLGSTCFDQTIQGSGGSEVLLPQEISGVYFLRISSEGKSQTQKVVLGL